MLNKEEIFRDDIESIVKQCEDIWFLLNNNTLYITGGTGFIGIWILESLYRANVTFNLNIKAIVLTRSINKFRAKAPHLFECINFTFEEGDIRYFKSQDVNCDYIIHAATDASAELNEQNPRLMYETILDGTKNILEFAVDRKIKKILFLSSGAVYGQQPWEMTHISESWNGSLDCRNVKNTYAEAKRSAELLCSIYAKQFNLNITTARIFSSIGPYLPIDTHFAIGNFILNAIEKKPIIVKGNGLPCRSFLYISDMTVWLFNMLVHGKNATVYNVGSSKSISIKDLAKKVSEVLDGNEYHILGENDSGWNLGRYVPDITLIKDELNVEEKVLLEDAILKTAIWNGWIKS